MFFRNSKSTSFRQFKIPVFTLSLEVSWCLTKFFIITIPSIYRILSSNQGSIYITLFVVRHGITKPKGDTPLDKVYKKLCGIPPFGLIMILKMFLVLYP